MELPTAEALPYLQAESKRRLLQIFNLPNEIPLMINQACFSNTATSLRQLCLSLFNAPMQLVRGTVPLYLQCECTHRPFLFAR